MFTYFVPEAWWWLVLTLLPLAKCDAFMQLVLLSLRLHLSTFSKPLLLRFSAGTPGLLPATVTCLSQSLSGKHKRPNSL